MKKYIEKIIPAVKRKSLESITCDLCGDVTTRRWRGGYFDATETEIKMRTGNNYPEGGFGEEVTIDICPKCFKDKLIPWVESHGGSPETKDWDW